MRAAVTVATAAAMVGVLAPIVGADPLPAETDGKTAAVSRSNVAERDMGERTGAAAASQPASEAAAQSAPRADNAVAPGGGSRVPSSDTADPAPAAPARSEGSGPAEQPASTTTSGDNDRLPAVDWLPQTSGGHTGGDTHAPGGEEGGGYSPGGHAGGEEDAYSSGGGEDDAYGDGDDDAYGGEEPSCPPEPTPTPPSPTPTPTPPEPTPTPSEPTPTPTHPTPSPSHPGELPGTGAKGGEWILGSIAAALVAAGGSVLVATRRARRRH